MLSLCKTTVAIAIAASPLVAGVGMLVQKRSTHQEQTEFLEGFVKDLPLDRKQEKKPFLKSFHETAMEASRTYAIDLGVVTFSLSNMLPAMYYIYVVEEKHEKNGPRNQPEFPKACENWSILVPMPAPSASQNMPAVLDAVRFFHTQATAFPAFEMFLRESENFDGRGNTFLEMVLTKDNFDLTTQVIDILSETKEKGIGRSEMRIRAQTRQLLLDHLLEHPEYDAGCQRVSKFIMKLDPAARTTRSSSDQTAQVQPLTSSDISLPDFKDYHMSRLAPQSMSHDFFVFCFQPNRESLAFLVGDVLNAVSTDVGQGTVDEHTIARAILQYQESTLSDNHEFKIQMIQNMFKMVDALFAAGRLRTFGIYSVETYIGPNYATAGPEHLRHQRNNIVNLCMLSGDEDLTRVGLKCLEQYKQTVAPEAEKASGVEAEAEKASGVQARKKYALFAQSAMHSAAWSGNRFGLEQLITDHEGYILDETHGNTVLLGIVKTMLSALDPDEFLDLEFRNFATFRSTKPHDLHHPNHPTVNDDTWKSNVCQCLHFVLQTAQALIGVPEAQKLVNSASKLSWSWLSKIPKPRLTQFVPSLFKKLHTGPDNLRLVQELMVVPTEEVSTGVAPSDMALSQVERTHVEHMGDRDSDTGGARDAAQDVHVERTGDRGSHTDGARDAGLSVGRAPTTGKFKFFICHKVQKKSGLGSTWSYEIEVPSFGTFEPSGGNIFKRYSDFYELRNEVTTNHWFPPKAMVYNVLERKQQLQDWMNSLLKNEQNFDALKKFVQNRS